MLLKMSNRVRIASLIAAVAMVTQTDVKGSGTAAITGGSTTFDIAWEYASRHWSGTMRMAGQGANDGAAIIGDVTYTDGCDGGKEKRGTFAVRRGPRTVTSLAR